MSEDWLRSTRLASLELARLVALAGTAVLMAWGSTCVQIRSAAEVLRTGSSVAEFHSF